MRNDCVYYIDGLCEKRKIDVSNISDGKTDYILNICRKGYSIKEEHECFEYKQSFIGLVEQTIKENKIAIK